MIYDIFTFNGEFDVLDIRLNILKDYVDTFIIVEAKTTFSGKPKPLYFLQVQEKYKDLPIKYYVVEEGDINIDKMAYLSQNTKGAQHWKTEFYQKESIKKALTDLKDEDICFISDCDEIWNPYKLSMIPDGIYRLRQNMHVYYLNMRSTESWTGTLLTKYKNIKNAVLNHLRTEHHPVMENEGWHFSSMGGLEEVRRKLDDSYTAESYNTPEVQAKLAERFGKSDYIGREFVFTIDESKLPQYLLDNKEKYAKMFYSHPTI